MKKFDYPSSSQKGFAIYGIIIRIAYFFLEDIRLSARTHTQYAMYFQCFTGINKFGLYPSF